jgi:hypothetical protein
MSIYGLESLYKSVARVDPFTGEKINKLRKSYEGQIKDFQLAGRNKSVKLKAERPNAPTMRETIGSFTKEHRGTYLETDEQWSRENAKHKIQMTDDFRSTVRLAMQLQPGRVRNEQKWDDVLGHEKKVPSQPISAPTPVPLQRPNGQMRQPPNAAELKRATRGKKRSYDDNSFVGYGDGFSDAEGAHDLDDAYDSGDGRSKKRRKV